jgi:hypothetical protein
VKRACALSGFVFVQCFAPRRGSSNNGNTRAGRAAGEQAAIRCPDGDGQVAGRQHETGGRRRWICLLSLLPPGGGLGFKWMLADGREHRLTGLDLMRSRDSCFNHKPTQPIGTPSLPSPPSARQPPQRAITAMALPASEHAACCAVAVHRRT